MGTIDPGRRLPCSLALGYYLSDLRPFRSELPDVGCYGGIRVNPCSSVVRYFLLGRMRFVFRSEGNFLKPQRTLRRGAVTATEQKSDADFTNLHELRV